jgi:hypothetical protein
MNIGQERRPPPPGYVPGATRFWGFSGGGGRVTYSSGYYFPHIVIYPVGGYYPTYYASYPWAEQAYDAPEMEGLAVEEGYLELHLAPSDAVVSIDSYEVGAGFADGERLTLAPGYHWIEVGRPGFRTEVYNVSIGAGRVYPIRSALSQVPATPEADAPPPARAAPAEKGSGTLKLKSTVPGAKIFVDGEAWGETATGAAGMAVLPAGDHSVRVEWPNGRPSISNVHLGGGETRLLELAPPGD